MHSLNSPKKTGLNFGGRLDPTQLTILTAGISFILGWLIPAIFKRYDKADLKIEILEDNLNTNPGSHKFLHIKVKNIERKWFLRFLFGEKAALFCKAKIEFKSQEGLELLQNSLDGRWSSTGEPVLQINQERFFQYNMVPNLRFDHIMPGEHANLAVATKIPGEKYFYAFDNVSYAFLSNIFRDLDKKIEEKNCKITVKLTSSDGCYPIKTFIINNPNDKLGSFKLLKL